LKKSYLILVLTVVMLLVAAAPGMAADTQNAAFSVASAATITAGEDMDFGTVNQEGLPGVVERTTADYFFAISGGPATNVTIQADTSLTPWNLEETVIDPGVDEIVLTFTGVLPLIETETIIKETSAVTINALSVPDGEYGGTMKLYAGTAESAPTNELQNITLTWDAIF